MAGSKIGYCKLCQSPYAAAINKLVAQDKNSSEVSAAMAPFDFTFTRKTFYTHKKHITSPLVTAVQHAQANPIVMPATNKGVLESIRDIGMRRAAEHPEEVTIDHALKAAQVLQSSEKPQESVFVILAKALAGTPMPQLGYVEEAEYVDEEDLEDSTVEE